MDTPVLNVTVIVPVWNGEDSIGACLEALTCQSYPKDRLEIIIVDNGSTDATATIIQSFPQVIYLLEPKPGSYAARNMGIGIATGSIIAFLDADCVADPDWVSNGVAHIHDLPNLGILAGHVEITATAESSGPVYLYEKTFAFRQIDLARSGKCVTANWMSPRTIFDDVGRFDANLKSGGDWLLSSRISGSGYAVLYVSEMIVRHPARSTMGDLLAKRRRVAGGEWTKSAKKLPFAPLLKGSIRDVTRKALKIWRSKDISLADRLSVSYVLVRANLAFSFELFRLLLGGQPKRS